MNINVDDPRFKNWQASEETDELGMYSVSGGPDNEIMADGIYTKDIAELLAEAPDLYRENVKLKRDLALYQERNDEVLEQTRQVTYNLMDVNAENKRLRETVAELVATAKEVIEFDGLRPYINKLNAAIAKAEGAGND